MLTGCMLMGLLALYRLRRNALPAVPERKLSNEAGWSSALYLAPVFPHFSSTLYPWPVGSLRVEEGGMGTSAMLGNWMIYLLWSASALVVIGSVLNAMRHTHPLASVKSRHASR